MSPSSRLTAAVPVLPALDLDAALTFYAERLGFAAAFRHDDYAGVARDGHELHLWRCTDPGLPRTTSCRFMVAGVDALYAELGAQGVVHPNGALEAKPWGLREFSVLDRDGNLLVFAERPWTPSATADEAAQRLNEFGAPRLPGLLGLEILTCDAARVSGRIAVTPPLVAGTGFLWAPVVIALADTLCAYGTGAARPKESSSFTTVELKTNFLGTVAAGGAIRGEATPVHLGRSTQVWDAVVRNEANDKPIALFRCTQMILYPSR